MTGANVPSEIIFPWGAVVTAIVRAVLQAWLCNRFPVDVSDMSDAVLAVQEYSRARRTWKRWEMLPKMAASSHC